MLPPRLASEIEELRVRRPVDVHEDPSFINVVLPEFPTGPEFNAPATTVLIRVPRSYPDAGPDMFWTDPALLLAGGVIPRNADAQESHLGRPWRRFSWHHNGWMPALHNLHTYLEFVRRRFRER